MGKDSQIAIVGMACRLPGADDPESLWSMLVDRRDGRTEVPKDRWNWKSFYHKNPDMGEVMNFSHAYFLKHDVSAFDARFFKVLEAEASGMDPQQRLLLEVAYEAVENAGFPIEDFRGSNTSVHMAMFARDYDRMAYRDVPHLHKTHVIGSGEAILANRISYLWDLKGTSNTLDTGCSGGLVALHQACRTLRAGESDMALAGASQLMLHPDQTMAMSQLTNADGRCYTFDDRGHGYARGEGIGVFLLKRLDKAIADGDTIHAVVVESGSNHDGKTAGIFVPNGDAQEALAKTVYANAGLSPMDTLYVEAHGTGTVAGDNQEIGSISRVFGREAGRTNEIIVGSVKSNIGHLESASGIASMIKAIMVLKKDQIPPQLNFINPKPTLRLEERGIRVPLELTPLTPKGHVGPRRVSVNSFGYGGTNAHAILEAYDGKSLKNGYTNGHTNGYANGHSNGHTNGYTNGHANGNSNAHTNGHTNAHNNFIVEESEEEQEDGKERLITLSANSELSLNSLMSRLGEWLGTDMAQDASFADLAYTLNVRRSKLPWRSTIVARNSNDLARALGDAKPRPVKSSRDVAVGFIFTGQGAQWHAMGRELLSDSHEFAASIALCNQIMKDAGSEWDLVEELSRDKDTSRLSDARFSQPCTTAVQIAMVDLLESFGIRPEALCGHSSGEVAAAYAAGILSRAAAMQVAYNRGICSAQAKDLNTTKGSMLAVGEGEEAISKRIKGLDKTNGRVTVACVNSPESTTISGDLPAILELQALLDAASVFNRRLKVDSAYHSHHMEVVAKSYLASLSDMSHAAPCKDVAFYSSVTGTRKLADFGPSYWVANLVSQVKFDAASKLVAEHLFAAHPSATNVVIEVGPHAALSGPLRQTLSNFTLASGATFKYNYLSCLMRNQSATETALTVAGKIFEYGGQVHLDAVTTMGKGKAASISSYAVVGNMPTYAWDHSSTYWHESRLSKDHRLRPFPRHDLLGTYDYYSSLHEPRWRYYVSLEHLPWLRDHVVEGLIVFPGVGYLIMVIEAMKQLFQLRKTPGSIKNVNLRDVNFLKAVVVPDDNAQDTKEVEMHLMISPSRQYAGTSWQEFSVVSYDPKNDAWVENCSGLTSWDAADPTAQPEVNEAVDIADDTLGHLTSTAAADMLRDCQTNSDLLLDPTEVYAGLAKTGNEYGPNFQGMKEIHVGKNRSYFKVVVENIVQQMPSQYQQPHTIHPSTFDSIIQPVALMFHRECALMPIMPTSLADMSVAVEIDETPGSELFVAFKFVPESRREGLAEFCTYQKQADGTFRPVITAYKVRPQAVGDVTSDDSAEKKASYRMEWKPDVDYLTQNDFMNHLSSQEMFDIHSSDGKSAEAQLSLNDTVAAIFIRRALQEMQTQGISSASNAHLSKLLAWMAKWNETEADKLLEGVTAEQETRLIEEAIRSNIAGLILSRLGPHYLDLVTGKVSAVELMAQDDLLRRLYSEHTLFSCHYTQMAEYMQHLVHKNPYIRVLEIDAGTGGATLPVLEKMERGDQLLVHEYTYTSVSSGSFELARSKFGKWESQINFKTLDISRDPLAQGYAANSFDVVVAAMELHAVPRMDAALANVRSLLKPGGRLVLLELTAVSAAHNAIFGTLASWWKSEDGRQDGPLLSVPEWDACLKRHGFSGTDLVIPAHKGPSSDVSTMIVARAIDASEAKVQNTSYSASVHLGHSDDAQATIGDKLCLSLTEAGVKCTQAPWTLNPSAAANELAIVIDSAENPLLLDPSPETFEQIKQLLLQGRNILWASFQCAEPSADTAAMKHMINGLARVMRRENPGLHLITVDIQDQVNPPDSGSLNHIVDTLKDIAKSFWPQSEVDKTEENEYVICDGQLTIPRVVPDDRFERYVESLNPAQDKCEATTYLDKGRPLMLDVQVPGLLNTLRFVDNESMSEPLGPDQVEIEARAHGLNQKDVSVALGRSAPGTTMLGEVAGVITAVGSNVSSWKAGDRVIGLLASPFGNQVRINGNGVVAIPDSISFSDAASIPWVYYTAWYCLTQVARLEKDQTVLIHAASGGVGQATIQLAKLIGAEIFVTVSGASKKEFLQQQYGIPSRNILSYRDFKRQIMSLTQGKGVDAVLNSLSGQALMESWDCVAQFGTFLEIGKADINGRSQLDMSNFEKQVTFAAIDPSLMYQLRPQQVTRGLREIFSMFEQGQLKTVHPVTVYPMTRVEETFRLVAARKHLGKVVLVADEQTQIQATRPKSAPLRLSKDGTYVIGGGLGDLGKKIGCFLASKGAGHIVALTRRTLDAEQRAPLEEMISSLGATLHIVKCDINDESSTLAAAQSIAHLPPVRGIVQSATVLADHPLEYMEHADWATAVKPKVQGTVNMNKAFCSAESTEFFVMLSSVASIFGSSSQGNYAAGNAFLDAFAHAQSQYSQGITKYTTINVGAVEGSGLVNQALSQNSEFVRTVGSVSFDEVLATIEYAMKPQSQVDQAKQCLMRFNRDSMEEAMGPEALGDHLFDHVPSKSRQGAKTSTCAADSKKASAIQAVEQAETLAEAEDIVKGAILEKFAAFTGDDVPEDQSVAALGLDSLVSIELKNWVKHTFQTPMQTSELIGAANIVVLAKLVVSRMDLKCNPKAADSSDSEQKQESVGQHGQESSSEAANDAVAKLSHGHECCKFHAELPVQPLPDLDVSLDFWLEANEHLFSPEQLESIHADIESLRAADSPARQILEILYSEHADDKTNGWLTDLVSKGRFLCNRASVAPGSSIMGAYRQSKVPRSQAEHAAVIALSTLSFKRAVSAGQVEPLDLGGKPECTWGWKWLFNSIRVPQLECDKMVNYASDDQNALEHIAVLRKGHVFKVMLQDELGKDVSFSDLQATFEAITERVQDDGVWSGMLTTDERDSWAEIRESLSASCVGNAEYFQAIDSALVVLCLDAGSPETPEEIARQGFIGDGFNRWFDKCLQIYVGTNGRSGHIQEHGMIDGTTPARLTEWLTAAVDNYPVMNGGINGSHSAAVKLDEVVLQTTPEIDSHIDVLRSRFIAKTSSSTYVREELDEFGSDWLMQSRAPVKGVIDMTFQLAVRLFFGQNMISWEPTSAVHFHKGRSDAVQRATPAVNAFCDAAAKFTEDGTVDSTELQNLLSAAVVEMKSGMISMVEGRDYLRLFEVLSHMWPSDATTPKPFFLSDMTFFGRPSPPIFAQTNTLDSNMIIDDYVHLLPDTNGFWSFLTPSKDKIRVSLTGGSKERTSEFVNELHRAARIMRDILKTE